MTSYLDSQMIDVSMMCKHNEICYEVVLKILLLALMNIRIFGIRFRRLWKN